MKVATATLERDVKASHAHEERREGDLGIVFYPAGRG